MASCGRLNAVVPALDAYALLIPPQTHMLDYAIHNDDKQPSDGKRDNQNIKQWHSVP
jgi:hypothetical protein